MEKSRLSCMGSLVTSNLRPCAHPISQWTKQFSVTPLKFDSQSSEALSYLVPLLLCGEQSAQLVFQRQAQQLSEKQLITPLQALAEVEADEAWHDEALQHVFMQLPVLNGQSRVRRHAQLFYASLGRCQDLSQQFTRIASLDASVTLLMQMIERGSLGKQHPFSLLCGLIKRDEAKHVYVSKRLARGLGVTKEQEHFERWSVLTPLLSLLEQQGRHFEVLGVDLNQFRSKLEFKWQ